MEITAAALAAELCGASQEDPLLAVLCEAAEAAWESRLDPGVTKEDAAARCGARRRSWRRRTTWESGAGRSPLPWVR